MNKARIQNTVGDDLVVVDMDTGAVELADSVRDRLDEAAEMWWKAVTLVHIKLGRKAGIPYRDIIFRAIAGSAVVPDGDRDSGDIVIQPGHNGHRGQVCIRPAVTPPQFGEAK